MAVSVLVFLIGTSSAGAFSGSGSGTEAEPYVITDVYQLQEMQDTLDAFYVLGNDIDASDTVNWNNGAGFEPVGTFTGTFDGRGHTITRFYINRPTTNGIALFRGTVGSEIKNIGMADVDITGSMAVGALVNYNADNSTILNCWSSGNVKSTYVGANTSGIGGLVGSNADDSLISQCYSNTNVTGNNAWQYGGLVGRNIRGSIIEDSYATGNVKGTYKVGGLVGDNMHGSQGGYVARCYSIGKVIGGGGGLVGFNWQGGLTYESYWDTQTSAKTSSKGGTGKQTSQMMQQGTFINWDFDEIWEIDEGQSYPYFKEPRVLMGLEIVGPNEIVEDSQRQYKAIAVYDNNSTMDVTALAGWSVEPNDNCSIDSGLLLTETIYLPEDVVISASYTEGEITKVAEKEVSIYAICPSGYALEFDGVDDYVSFSQNVVTTLEFTVSAWANQHGTGGGERNQCPIFIQRDDYAGDYHSTIALFTDRGTSEAWASIRGSNSPLQGLTAPRKGFNEWHHYAMTVSLSDFIFYIDGSEVARASNNQSGDYHTSIDTVNIGRHLYYANGRYIDGGFFNGLIDEVSIYNRALSGEDILAGMYRSADGDELNLVGYWGFDEGEGDIAGDGSGNGNDGTIIGAQWTDDIPPVGICNFVAVDIKPGSCPNPLNLKSKGILPVTILGSEEFDVSTVIETSVQLEGIGAIRHSFEDVATPVMDGNECECSIEGPDGYIDLTLKFRTQEIVEELIDRPEELVKDQILALTLTGDLFDGTAIEGHDCVVLVGNVPKWLAAQRWDGNEDGVINFFDLAELATYWLESQWTQ